MTESLLNSNTMIDLRDAFNSVFINSYLFNEKLYKIFAHTYSACVKTILQNNSIMKDFPELDKILRNRVRYIFDERLREEEFITTLSDTVASYSKLAKRTGFGKTYQHLSNLLSVWNNDVVEPIRDTLWRTPSHKIHEIEKYSLFHYNPIADSSDDTNTSGSNKPSTTSATTTTTPTTKNLTPLLVVYAFINRHYILDLLPEVSVIKNLLKHGFDIYATDWGTPSAYDKDLTIGHFVNSYMDKSVDLIRKNTKTDKVSLFGYCWGGNLVLMYAALHPEKVKNVVTIATPGDFGVDNTLLSLWTKDMKVDALLDAFGNAPSMLLNAAFSLRNPIENIHKYPHFFEQPHGLESTMEFFATETWLYDSPPVIGEIYREFVKYCYQQNLFIKNQMEIYDSSGSASLIDLKNITAPFLNVIAQKDDLVTPLSSIALNNAVGSKDKSMIESPAGHVGLIIGQRAHKEVWPKVGSWLQDRS